MITNPLKLTLLGVEQKNSLIHPDTPLKCKLSLPCSPTLEIQGYEVPGVQTLDNLNLSQIIGHQSPPPPQKKKTLMLKSQYIWDFFWEYKTVTQQLEIILNEYS